jgi:hypothetical protein
MKIQRPTQAKNERKLSDAIMTKHYLDLQRLRDEVREAELGRGLHALSPKEATRPSRSSNFKPRC